MTFSQARTKLRRYYRILELAHEYHLKSTDVIVVVDNAPRFMVSPEEAEVVRRLDLLASVRDVGEALKNLSLEQQKFLELRFGKEYSLRQVAREMHMAVSTAHKYETAALSAFIVALDKIPAAS